MSILAEDDLQFARRHLERFADSDFFPPLDEYRAIWTNWADFSERLRAENVVKLPLAPALAMPAAKGRNSYRIVHQLDPMTSLTYTALVHGVAGDLEAARAGPEVACSYRYIPDDGAFFSGGAGYEIFRARSEELAATHAYGASVDIADFYNQIYSHRVRGAIEAAAPALANLAHDVERVVHTVNAGASKGIPVGGDPSAILAEGVLIDVDQLIRRYGLEHTRYVDDIRIYSADEERLHGMLESLSEYLYEHHRLHLNSAKTRLLPMDRFLKEVIHDHSDDEIDAAIEKLGQLDPYGDGGLEPDDVPENDVLEQIGAMISGRWRKTGHVDLNLIKAYLRRARRAGSSLFVPIVIEATEAFVPAIHELVRSMTAVLDADGAEPIAPLVLHLRASPFYSRKAVRLWLDWLCAGSAGLMRVVEIREAVFSSALRFQARAAVTMKDLAWVRAQRATFVGLPPTDRSAVMMSMQLLGADERRHLLNQIANTASPVDLAVKKLLLDL
jgi:hypothetical protein